MTLLAPPAWHAQAACRDETAELFFETDLEPLGDRREREQAAVKVCQACPVHAVCLEDALTRAPEEQVEVRGGYTAKQRRTELERRSANTPQHATHLANGTSGAPRSRVDSHATLALLGELRAAGHTLPRIAAAGGLSHGTVEGFSHRRPGRVSLGTAAGIARAHTVLLGGQAGVAA